LSRQIILASVKHGKLTRILRLLRLWWSLLLPWLCAFQCERFWLLWFHVSCPFVVVGVHLCESGSVCGSLLCSVGKVLFAYLCRFVLLRSLRSIERNRVFALLVRFSLFSCDKKMNSACALLPSVFTPNIAGYSLAYSVFRPFVVQRDSNLCANYLNNIRKLTATLAPCCVAAL